VLELRELHAHYGKGHVLHGVSLTVPSGEVVGLIGRNGVGKTTTLKAAVGLVRPSAGAVLVDGRDVAGSPPYRIAAAGVGYVPEERRIFPDFTVLENLLVGIRALPPATQQERLEEIFEHFPRLRERRGQLGGGMSGGEKQMLAIARALVTRPRLLLIDEPTEGLMPAMVHEVGRILARVRAEGVAVLLVDQDLDLLREQCRVVHVMERGRIVRALEAGDLGAGAAVLAQYFGTV
jgi:branched-chain amino acid transport system ATP-binding protein